MLHHASSLPCRLWSKETRHGAVGSRHVALGNPVTRSIRLHDRLTIAPICRRINFLPHRIAHLSLKAPQFIYRSRSGRSASLVTQELPQNTISRFLRLRVRTRKALNAGDISAHNPGVLPFEFPNDYNILTTGTENLTLTLPPSSRRLQAGAARNLKS